MAGAADTRGWISRASDSDYARPAVLWGLTRVTGEGGRREHVRRERGACGNRDV